MPPQPRSHSSSLHDARLLTQNTRVLSQMGGAIYNGGKLTMYECILTNNGYARPKDYVFFMAPNPLTHSGGAILNYGIIEMHACIVTANSAAYVRAYRPIRAASPYHLSASCPCGPTHSAPAGLMF